MSEAVWKSCLDRLEGELTPQDFNTYISSLQAVVENGVLRLFAPNRYIRDEVEKNFVACIERALERAGSGDDEAGSGAVKRVVVEVGSPSQKNERSAESARATLQRPAAIDPNSGLQAAFTFENLVTGYSNQIASAASMQAADNPEDPNCNILFIYGGVGLGKTHLMHAIGNHLLQERSSEIIYRHSEQFVNEMVFAIQRKCIGEFAKFYRSVDALLIDDVQFFAGKERSQAEFFHTLNALFERKKLVVLSSDRYPKEIDGIEERLKSRFSGSGLPVFIEPPDREMRAEILDKKALAQGIDLPGAVRDWMAKEVHSNVRDLEGALNRVIATARFMKRELTVELAKEALRDLLASQGRRASIENIQSVAASRLGIRVADIKSRKKTRPITRCRQIAMALARELTEHSLPEIGDAFGGRDHTTVLHACRKIKELRATDPKVNDDYQMLLRQLTS